MDQAASQGHMYSSSGSGTDANRPAAPCPGLCDKILAGRKIALDILIAPVLALRLDKQL